MFYISVNEIPQKFTDMSNNFMMQMAQASSQVVECFLCEYCEVSKIKEETLKERITLISDMRDCSLNVVENNRIILRCNLRGEKKGSKTGVIKWGYFLLEKAKYPKTLAFIREKCA